MTFAEMIADDLDHLVFNTSEFAQTITYNSASIPAVVTYGENLDDIAGRQIGVQASVTIEVKASDVPAPKVRDTVVIGGVTYRVLRLVRGDAYVKQIALSTDERPAMR
jgi:hypothetical protein